MIQVSIKKAVAMVEEPRDELSDEESEEDAEEPNPESWPGMQARGLAAILKGREWNANGRAAAASKPYLDISVDNGNVVRYARGRHYRPEVALRVAAVVGECGGCCCCDC